MPHLFVDISSHGFGHLAQTAPILNALEARLPALQLTVRSGLPRQRLASRIAVPFAHLHAASDFGFQMLDALRVDLPATAARYRAAHADWPAAVAAEAGRLAELEVDFVLSNASYLPLAAAAQAGVPAAACCSLNWSELFEHFFGQAAWAAPIAEQIAAAYRSAPFLALEPAMPMAALPNVRRLPPVALVGEYRRAEIDARLPAARSRRLVLVGFGGIPIDRALIDVGSWARRARAQGESCCWLVPAAWAADDVDCVAADDTGLAFSDLLASCDAVVTKPGYGTFVEAACAGTPVLWLRRDDWPEQDCLIAWLRKNAVERELSPAELLAGTVPEALAALCRQARPARPLAAGAAAAAGWIAARLAAC